MSVTAFSAGCHSSDSAATQPKAVISQKVPLPDIPSASGIEWVGDHYYVIGDDSPYLFCLNAEFKVVQKVPLLEADSLVEGRIPKTVKPDLEAITSLTLDGQPYVFIIGSGSTTARHNGYLVPLSRQGAGKPVLIPLQPLYDQLRHDKSIIGEATLNIEGLAADEEYLYLLQRFAPGGNNVLITYTLSAIEPYLSGKGPAPKPNSVQTWALPEMEQIKTGFSGLAQALGGRLLFTASAEETPNAVLDGEIYGSLVGWLKAHTADEAGHLAKPQVVVPITEANGTPYKSKVESICIIEEDRHHLQAVAVSDNDNGASELIKLTFSW